MELLVQAYKLNRAKHYSYPVQLLAKTPDMLIVHGSYDRLLNHPGRQLADWPAGGQTIEFHFLNKPFNIVAAWNTDGSFHGYYCTVTTPATLEENEIHCIDLDLDLRVDPDFTYTVEDEDEFEEHRVAWNYPAEVVTMARWGLRELITNVVTRSFPFDGSAELLYRDLKGSQSNAADTPSTEVPRP